MLVKTNNRIINLDKVVEIVKDDSNLILIFYFTDESRSSVKFEDESMLDKAFNRIISVYFNGHLICDITEYVKKGE